MRNRRALRIAILRYLAKQAPGEKVGGTELVKALQEQFKDVRFEFEDVREQVEWLVGEGYVEWSGLTPKAFLCWITSKGRLMLRELEGESKGKDTSTGSGGAEGEGRYVRGDGRKDRQIINDIQGSLTRRMTTSATDPKMQLEQQIRECNDNIFRLEDEMITITDPIKKRRYQKRIEEQKALIREKLRQYSQLCKNRGISMPNDIRDMMVLYLEGPGIDTEGDGDQPRTPQKQPVEGDGSSDGAIEEDGARSIKGAIVRGLIGFISVFFLLSVFWELFRCILFYRLTEAIIVIVVSLGGLIIEYFSKLLPRRVWDLAAGVVLALFISLFGALFSQKPLEEQCFGTKTPPPTAFPTPVTSTPTFTPTLSSTPTGTPTPTITSTPTPTGTPTPTPTACIPSARLIEHTTYPSKDVFSPGEGFTATWRFRNDGGCPWPRDTRFGFVKGDQMGGPSEVAIGSLEVGGMKEVSVKLIAPSTDGRYEGWWQLQDSQNQPLADPVRLVINVESPPSSKPPPQPLSLSKPRLTGMDIIGCNVTFKWDWSGTLEEDWWFAVRIGKKGEEPHSVVWVKEQSYIHSFQDFEPGEYVWKIAVCQGDPGDHRCSSQTGEELVVSERSEFEWRGCSPPSPPTATPPSSPP